MLKSSWEPKTMRAGVRENQIKYQKKREMKYLLHTDVSFKDTLFIPTCKLLDIITIVWPNKDTASYLFIGLQFYTSCTWFEILYKN